MAITFVGGRTQAIAGANSGTTSVALTGLTGGSGSQPGTGDLVLLGYASGKTADQVIAISGYAEAAELYSNGSGADANLEVAHKFMGATPDTTVAMPNSGSTADAVAVHVRVYRGVDPNNPFDVAAVTAANTGTTNPNPGAITPTTAGAVLVAFGAGAIAGTGTGFSSSDLTGFQTLNSPDTNDATIGGGHKTDWTSGAFDAAAWTGGVSGAGNSWAAVAIALRPLLTTTHQGAFAAAGTGTFAAAAKRQLAGAFAVQGSGATAFAAVKRAVGALAAGGAGTAAFAARMTTGAALALNGAGSLAARGVRITAGAIAAAGAGTTALAGRLVARGRAAFAASGSLSASGNIDGAGGSKCSQRKQTHFRIGF